MKLLQPFLREVLSSILIQYTSLQVTITSLQQTLNAWQKEEELCQAREEGPKLRYKDLITIAEKKFGISLSDSQITHMIKIKSEFLSLKNDNKGVKRIRTAKWLAVVADLQDPNNQNPSPPVTLLQAAEWAEGLSRFFDAGRQSRIQINYVARLNRLLVRSNLSGRPWRLANSLKGCGTVPGKEGSLMKQ